MTAWPGRSEPCRVRGKESLSRNKILGVRDELRICASSQFVKIEALALSLHGYPVGVYAVEQPVDAVCQGQNKAKQRGHAHQLRQPLPGVASQPSGGPGDIQDGAMKPGEQ